MKIFVQHTESLCLDNVFKTEDSASNFKNEILPFLNEWALDWSAHYLTGDIFAPTKVCKTKFEEKISHKKTMNSDFDVSFKTLELTKSKKILKIEHLGQEKDFENLVELKLML